MTTPRSCIWKVVCHYLETVLEPILISVSSSQPTPLPPASRRRILGVGLVRNRSLGEVSYSEADRSVRTAGIPAASEQG